MTETEKRHIENIQKQKESGDVYRLFSNIPSPERTDNIIIAAMRRAPDILNIISDSQWTEHVILATTEIDKGEYNIQIPANRLTDSVCFLLIKKDPSLIAELPHGTVHENLCRYLMQSWVKDLESLTTLINATSYPELRKEIVTSHENIYKGRPVRFILDIIKDYRNDIALFLFDKYPHIYPVLSLELKDYNRSLKIVSLKGAYLKYVPEETKTKELCLIAYQNNPEAYRHIPEKYFDDNLAMDIIKRFPEALHDIPMSYRSKEICMVAAGTGDITLAPAIPYPDVWVELLRNENDKFRSSRDSYLNCFDRDLMPPELAKEILRKDPGLYYFFSPEIKKHQEVCELAVSLDLSNINDLPPDNRTKEMYVRAAKEEASFLQGLPSHLQTKEICRKLVGINPSCLAFIPSTKAISRETYRDVLKALQNNQCHQYELFKHIPYYDLCLEGMKNLKDPLQAEKIFHTYLPEMFKTGNMLMEAVKKSGYVIFGLQPFQLNQDICNLASATSPAVLNWIPEHFRTPDMYIRAVKANPIYEDSVPQQIREGDNIFSFCTRAEAFLKKKFTYDEICSIHKGEPFRVDQLKTDTGTKQPATLRWDKKQEQFVEATPLQMKSKKRRTPKIK